MFDSLCNGMTPYGLEAVNGIQVYLNAISSLAQNLLPYAGSEPLTLDPIPVKVNFINSMTCVSQCKSKLIGGTTRSGVRHSYYQQHDHIVKGIDLLSALPIVSLSPDLPTSRSTRCIASPAIPLVLREVGRSGNSETTLPIVIIPCVAFRTN